MSESKAMNVRMEPADNGCTISYELRVPTGPYDASWIQKREVFEFGPKDKAGMMKAMQRFCELSCMGEKEEKGEDD